MFITFEGGDGAGKSTAISRLKEFLEDQGKEVVSTREPGGVPLGEEIRNILLHSKSPVTPISELLLFLAARAQHVEEKIRPALQAQKVVLCDRFTDSTLAYQGYARGFPLEKLLPLCELASGGLVPDLTFYLDLDPEIGLQRAVKERNGHDRMEQEEKSFHNRVREGFLKLASLNPARIHQIDASKSPDEVFQDILRICRVQI